MSSNDNCAGCSYPAQVASLEAENQRLFQHIQQLERYIEKLEEHIEKLEEYIEKLEKIIKKMREALERIWRYVVGVLRETRRVLGQRSGVPRGEWAYAVGANEVAEEVEKLVREACQ